MATILPEIKSSLIISLGKLCDDSCDIVLNKKKIHAVKDNEVILEGIRKKLDGLWDILIPKTKIAGETYKTTQTNLAMYIQHTSKQAARFIFFRLKIGLQKQENYTK